VHLRQREVERSVLATEENEVEMPLDAFQAGPATLTVTRPCHRPIVREVTLQKGR
jgi:hypothetical protein